MRQYINNVPIIQYNWIHWRKKRDVYPFSSISCPFLMIVSVTHVTHFAFLFLEERYRLNQIPNGCNTEYPHRPLLRKVGTKRSGKMSDLERRCELSTHRKKFMEIKK